MSLFPAINAERFGGDPRTLGLFTTAIGVGGMISALCAGPLRHASRLGLIMLACATAWGGAFAVFAVAPSLWLTLVALGVAGLVDTFTVVVRGMMVQAATPDALRGRVNAADFLVGAGGPQLGSLEAGLVGSLASPAVSALSGGLLTVLGTLVIGVALPGFRRYRALPEPGGEAEPGGRGRGRGRGRRGRGDGEALRHPRLNRVRQGVTGEQRPRSSSSTRGPGRASGHSPPEPG